jgi:hypothetical protein
MELPVDAIQRTRRSFIADRVADKLAKDQPIQTHVAHQPFNNAASYGEPFTPHLPPNLAHAVNSEVLGERPRMKPPSTKMPDIELQLAQTSSVRQNWER